MIICPETWGAVDCTGAAPGGRRLAGGGEAPAAKPEARAGGPGLGDAKRPAAPPAGGQGEQGGRGGAEGRLQNQRRKSQGGPWGGGPSGQKRKRAALRAIFPYL